MDKIVILGCGYLGYHLALNLSNTYEVVVIGKQNEYSDNLNDRIQFIQSDVYKMKNEVVKELENAIILNVTGRKNTTEKLSDASDMGNDVENFIGLLKTVNNAKAKRFVQISSGGTLYGDVAGLIAESQLPNPVNIYGLSNLIYEKLLHINYLETGLQYQILRLANPYGGLYLNNQTQGIIGVLVKNAIEGKVTQIWAPLSNERDYIHVNDFSEALNLCINSELINEVINVGTGISTSLSKIIETVEEALGSKVAVEINKSDIVNISSNVLDNSKLVKLGFKNSEHIDTEIKNLVLHLKNQ